MLMFGLPAGKFQERVENQGYKRDIDIAKLKAQNGELHDKLDQIIRNQEVYK